MHPSVYLSFLGMSRFRQGRKLVEKHVAGSAALSTQLKLNANTKTAYAVAA